MSNLSDNSFKSTSAVTLILAPFIDPPPDATPCPLLVLFDSFEPPCWLLPDEESLELSL